MSASKTALNEVLGKICAQLQLPSPAKLVVEAPKDSKFGDLSTNMALLLAKAAGKPPRELAAQIAEQIAQLCPQVAKVEVAGPGFVNVTFKPQLWQQVILDVANAGAAFGKSNVGNGVKALVEYVSANPTGPLHVGHGRGAALGDSIARILAAAGYDVSTEYYLNDAGRQMRILGRSIWVRLQQILRQPVEIPEDFYKGEYITDLARDLLSERPDIEQMDEGDALALCQAYGMEQILQGIRDDLARFRCGHDRYASEAALVQDGSVSKALEQLAAAGKTWEEDGALWLRTSEAGDDRNRVLRKSDGFLTYLASDIAYHADKFSRGYDWLIDVWGADHHGYIPRMKAAIAFMGRDPARFSVVLVQLVNLLRKGELIPMSTRAGQFETLEAVLNEVGPDAARFIFLSRSSDSPLDFDLELAREHTLENPVYYVQYAHARVCALKRRAESAGIAMPPASWESIAPLTLPEELAIMRLLESFSDVVADAARNLAPHYITRFLQDLAGLMHSYYASHKILVDDDLPGSIARLQLLLACAQVLKNGLELLGVSAPETM